MPVPRLEKVGRAEVQAEIAVSIDDASQIGHPAAPKAERGSQKQSKCLFSFEIQGAKFAVDVRIGESQLRGDPGRLIGPRQRLASSVMGVTQGWHDLKLVVIQIVRAEFGGNLADPSFQA